MNGDEQRQRHNLSVALNARLDELLLIVENDDRRLVDFGLVIKTLIARIDALEARTDARVSLHTMQLDAVESAVSAWRGWRADDLTRTQTLWGRLRWLVKGMP